jgi:hypothetical protein
VERKKCVLEGFGPPSTDSFAISENVGRHCALKVMATFLIVFYRFFYDKDGLRFYSRFFVKKERKPHGVYVWLWKIPISFVLII